MTLFFLSEGTAPKPAAGVARQDQPDAQLPGQGARIVCSPWEGIYLEQARTMAAG